MTLQGVVVMFKTERFGDATSEGRVVERDGWHSLDERRSLHGHHPGCGCRKTTDKGAYRDVSVEMPDGRVIHYYHQSPVVVELPDGRLRLSSCGYRTATTKERINRHLPSGYFVRQRDFEWYLEMGNYTVDFEDGMVVDLE